MMNPTDIVTLLNAHGVDERKSPTTDRGGIPFSPADYKFEDFRLLFPIPQSEMLINDKLTQNPDYHQ